MADADAAALFGWARNERHFAQRLDRDPRVLLLDFERMCTVRDHLDRALDHFRVPHPRAVGQFKALADGMRRPSPAR